MTINLVCHTCVLGDRVEHDGDWALVSNRLKMLDEKTVLREHKIFFKYFFFLRAPTFLYFFLRAATLKSTQEIICYELKVAIL